MRLDRLHCLQVHLTFNRSNPLGKVFTRDELEAIGSFCVKHDIIILSDEVYEHLSYTPFVPIASISPEVASITLMAGSAGKSFFLTGWRVGWIIGPQRLLKHVTEAHIAICFSSVSPLQEAVASALTMANTTSFWKTSVAEMRKRMSFFNEIWNELGITVIFEVPNTCCTATDLP